MENLQEKIVSDEERQQEAERLQHGINSLELFDKEVEIEERLDAFLEKTHPKTETREAILQGPSFKGDERKLGRAILKARNRYSVHDVQIQAAYEHALYLGVPAKIVKKQLIVPGKDNRELVVAEHINWRHSFALKGRANERNRYIELLENQKDSTIRELKPELEVGVSVSIEDRAILLTRALNAIARRSQLSGLSIGIADPKHNEAIFELYQDDTYRIDSAATRKVDRLLAQVKRDFWASSGYAEVRRAGLVHKRELKLLAQQDWQSFDSNFEYSLRRTERDNFRERLKDDIPKDRLDETKFE